MTDQPYTEADLRAEAARQHYALTDDAEYGCVGESMQDRGIGDTSETWTGLPRPDYEAAKGAIHDLIIHAADLSEWAVGLGADGLEPAEHPVNLRHQGRPVVRAHLAFPPHLTETERDDIAEAIAEGIAAAVGLTRAP